MKKEKIRSLALLPAIMLLLSLPAYGQSNSSVDYSGTSELEFSLGLPTPQFATAYSDIMHGFSNILSIFAGMIDEVPPPVERSGGPASWIPTFRLEYGYNVNRWLNVGGGAYYTYNSFPMKYSDTGLPAWLVRSHTMSITANVRFYWLNLGIVRMYSGLGVGIGIVNSNMSAKTEEESSAMRSYPALAMDVRLIGITVGKRLYGRFEAGVLGTGLVTAGIGYRF